MEHITLVSPRIWMAVFQNIKLARYLDHTHLAVARQNFVWSIVTESYQEAFQWEHQIKGWNRAKKEALIRGDIEGIHQIVKAERKYREVLKRDTRAKRSDECSEERRRSANNQSI